MRACVRALLQAHGAKFTSKISPLRVSSLFTLESPSITCLRPSRTDGSFPAIWRACTLRPFLTDKRGGGTAQTSQN